MKIGDGVVQFGSVTAENFQGLQNIASVVQHSVNVSLLAMFSFYIYFLSCKLSNLLQSFYLLAIKMYVCNQTCLYRPPLLAE